MLEPAAVLPYYAHNLRETDSVAKDRETQYEAGGILFVGLLAVGAGVGLWANQLGPGTLIGFGAGFVAMGVLAVRR